MRTVIFSAILLAVASVGFLTLIPASLTAARDDKPATFSERFEAALTTPALTTPAEH